MGIFSWRRQARASGLMDDLDKRLEQLKQAMAEPLTAPKAERDPDEFYRWLLKKQGEYRKNKREESHGTESPD
jgi:hypothetical protein